MMKKTTQPLNAHFDLISTLPDELLILVLSFLTTKEAVQTCILFKRWRRLCLRLPILKFNIDEFAVDDSIGASDQALRQSITRFFKFANGVLDNLESTHLDSVSYVHDTKLVYPYKLPMQWLHRVALLMPQLIDISIAKVRSLELPHSLFSCATLQHLEIKLSELNETPVMPPSINLPFLKVFHLSGTLDVELYDNFAHNLLTGCPSLETLKLFRCMLHFSSISSNSLKDLDIRGCHQYEPIQVSCPSLFSLHFVSSLRGGANLSFKNMKFLKVACIMLTTTRQLLDGGDVPVLNILSSLSNATKLRLYVANQMLNV